MKIICVYSNYSKESIEIMEMCSKLEKMKVSYIAVNNLPICEEILDLNLTYIPMIVTFKNNEHVKYVGKSECIRCILNLKSNCM